MALGLSPEEIVKRGEHKLLTKADHWSRVPLASVAHVQNGFAFKSDLFSRDAGVPLIRIRDIARRNTEHKYRGSFDDLYVVHYGDILVGMDGDFLATQWAGNKALLNQRVCKLTVESKHFSKSFFFLCLQPFLDAINAETSSVTVKHLSSRTVEAIPLPLPPLAEQHRIVAKIKELFAEMDKGVESLKRAREQLKVYRQAVLKHAFEGKLTAQWREENKDKLETPEQLLARIKQEREARYKQQLEEWQAAVKTWEESGKSGKKPPRPNKLTEVSSVSDDETKSLPALVRGWSYLRLGLVIDEPKYGTSKKCDYNYQGTGVLRIPNVIDGVIDVSDLKGAPFEDFEKQTYALKSGDILMIRSNGSISIVGQCAVISESEEKYLFAGYLIRLRGNPTVISSGYLAALLSSHLVRTQIEYKAKSTSGVNNVNSHEIRSLIVPLCGLPEQKVVMERLSECLATTDVIENLIEDGLLRANALRQSVLKRAFSGQLVPQDPNDEPASKLLERIKAEKAASVQTGNSPKKRPRARAAT